MKTLAEAAVKLAQRGFHPSRLLHRLSRLHHKIANQHERGLAHRRLHVIAHETPHRKDSVVPRISGIQVADDMEKMKFLAWLEHAFTQLAYAALPSRLAVLNPHIIFG